MIKKYSKIISIICICIFIIVCILAAFFKLNLKHIPVNSNVIDTFQNQESLNNIQDSNIIGDTNSIVNTTNSIQNETKSNEEITEIVTDNNSSKDNVVDSTEKKAESSEDNDVELNEEKVETNKDNNVELNKEKIESSKDSDVESNEEKVESGKENINSNNITGDTPYFIKVNCGAQVVTIYKKDNSGNYTVPYKAMICSTGTDTQKSGIYKIPGRWNWGELVGNVYGQYITVITGEILFHSVPYLERYNPGSLEYEEYDKLGTPASAGCVRLTVEDALWIWNNCENGTKVEFYSSSNPGPLGKPTVKKISNAEGELKNWDPTDPDNNNPWNKQ